MIQLNAFKVEKNALQFYEKIRGQGYPAILDHGKGERWFKVKVGPFEDWERAKSISNILRKSEKLSPLILISFGEKEGIPTLGPENTGSSTRPADSTQSGIAENIKKEKKSLAKNDFGPDLVEGVIARFLAWKTAWQEKKLETYLGFYSNLFDSAPRTRQAWERSRKKALGRDGSIQIQVGEMEIVPDGERIEMRFIQKFKSRDFQDEGLKTLVWGYEDGQWKILSERWFPI